MGQKSEPKTEPHGALANGNKDRNVLLLFGFFVFLCFFSWWVNVASYP